MWRKWMVRGDMLRFWCTMQRVESILFSMRTINCMSCSCCYGTILTSCRVAAALLDLQLLPRSLILNHHLLATHLSASRLLANQPACPRIPPPIPLLLLSIHSPPIRVLLRPAAAHGLWLIMCAAHHTAPPMIPRRAALAVPALHHLLQIANPELCTRKSILLAPMRLGITV
jgi:hypothetical protein